MKIIFESDTGLTESIILEIAVATIRYWQRLLTADEWATLSAAGIDTTSTHKISGHEAIVKTRVTRKDGNLIVSLSTEL